MKNLEGIKKIGLALGGIWGTLEQLGDIEEKPEELNLETVAIAQKTINEVVETAEDIRKKLQLMYDKVRYVLTPGVMDNGGVERVKITGIGTVYLMSDYRMSVKSGQKQQAVEWLISQGLGDIIQETINSSTLKGTLKEVIAQGKQIPEDIFNVNPFTRAQIKK